MSDNYSKIIAAVDFSSATEQILNRAQLIAQQNGADLILIHVNEPVLIAFEGMSGVNVDFEAQLEKYAQEQMQIWGDKYGVDASRRLLRVGSTKHEITKVVEEQDIDLIVIGSHGRSGVALLLGSTANAVLHGSPCDVMAVRIKE